MSKGGIPKDGHGEVQSETVRAANVGRDAENTTHSEPRLVASASSETWQLVRFASLALKACTAQSMAWNSSSVGFSFV